MKIATRSLCSAALVAGMTVVSPAASVFYDNFDSYANQAAFEAAWTPIGTVTPIGATLATDQASSSPQSVRVDGTATSGQQRNQHSFAETGLIDTLTTISFSFDFYDSNPAAAPYRQFSVLQDGTGTATGQILGMGLNNNQLLNDSGGNFYMARITGYTPLAIDPDGGPNESGTLGSGAFFKLNDFANSPLRTVGWHNLKMTISTDDGLSADFAFYVDNILAERVSNVGTAAQFRSYDYIRLGSGFSNASNAAWYDNFSVDVTAVPEPSTVGLCLFGALALIFSCGRQRRHA
ncbi:MAG TPA: PEP-CTERM sorting domain-containing protein [Verrucomicrobiae bacterium]|nr:PEP-CTERM sorting domain-containing protein [Verrucomicrobiae bacterium]